MTKVRKSMSEEIQAVKEQMPKKPERQYQTPSACVVNPTPGTEVAAFMPISHSVIAEAVAFVEGEDGSSLRIGVKLDSKDGRSQVLTSPDLKPGLNRLIGEGVAAPFAISTSDRITLIVSQVNGNVQKFWLTFKVYS